MNHARRSSVCSVRIPVALQRIFEGSAQRTAFRSDRGLGVFRLNEPRPEAVPGRGRRPIIPPVGGARDIFITHMPMRYDAEHFVEDLMLEETADRNNFQASYVLRHPWKGEDSACAATEEYRHRVAWPQYHEAPRLAGLTGWDIRRIRTQMNLCAGTYGGDEKRWRKL